jgi:hypothetical protein
MRAVGFAAERFLQVVKNSGFLWKPLQIRPEVIGMLPA